MKNNYESALSFDIEDGINILMRDIFNIDMLPTRRVVENVEIILDLLDTKVAKGTFFILGEIAEHYPSLVQSISNKGHEIGVHGYHHDLIFNLTPKQAREDLKRAKELIEQLIGKMVSGFRAPAFSITEHTSWILDILVDTGFNYDSSIMPVNTRRAGWKGFNEEIQQLKLKSGNSIIEVPLSSTKLLWKKIPVGGGGYLRHYPYSYTRKAFSQIQKQRAPILYMHPYEIDTKRYPEYFYRAKSTLPLRKRIPLSFYRLNKKTVLRKLDMLLDEFNFKPINSIIESHRKQGKMMVTEL